MILGMSLSTFTTLHVVLSLIGIASGVACLIALVGSRVPAGLTLTFLLTTVATSVTGFFFPDLKIGPPVVFGIVSLVVLTPVLLALYQYRLAGPWRWIYITGAAFALYLNSVVGVVQAFQKLAFLKPLAPTQSEPPFLVAQLVVLVVIVGLTVLALRRFRPAAA
ncbi:MAG: hypothetical protein HYZ40_04215 [Rhodospirillales bacterium]|nr:hypothetical protein [Rhodospirillales bacterium]